MSDRSGDGADVIAPPPLVYAIPLLGGLLLDRALRLPSLPSRVAVPAGLATLAGGLGLGAWFASTMRRNSTPINPTRRPTRLVVDGPFRYTRNPGYLGLGLVYTGVALLARGGWPLLLLPGVIAVIDRGVIQREERHLQGQFGRAYEQYRLRVRRWV